jgi:hypothetical protein
MADFPTCPACGRKLTVPASFNGQMVQCPDCAHQFVAQSHVQSVQATPPSAASRMPDLRRRREPDYDDDFDDDSDDRRPLRHSGIPHRGGRILALGIISLVIFPYATVVCGPLAWIMGNADLAEMNAGRMDPGGESTVRAGRVLGMFSTGLMTAVMLLVCLILGLFGVAGVLGN